MSVLLAVMLITYTALLTGCGGKREIPEEETGTPTTVPAELLLYREARDVFLAWMSSLGPGEDVSKGWELLSERSRRRLSQLGVRNAAEFAGWYQRSRELALAPFRYSFSRVDVLDIDTRDTTRAVITATFVVEVDTRPVESIASFFLVRQRGRWRVPFGDAPDWERSWWQQDSRFGASMRQEGLQPLRSERLGLDLLYPVTWDAGERVRFRAPGEMSPVEGVELSYLNPASMKKEAVVRLWRALPHGPGVLPDTTASMDSLIVEGPEPAALTDAVPLTGEQWRVIHPRSGTVVYAFGGVDPAVTSYGAFSGAIRAILGSLKPPS